MVIDGEKVKMTKLLKMETVILIVMTVIVIVMVLKMLLMEGEG